MILKNKRQLLNISQAAIKLGLVNKKSYLKIKNFGSFNLRKKNSRIGRNPKNKIDHEISERNVLTFKAADKLNKKVNSHVKKKN